jgi:hypothetical protein
MTNQASSQEIEFAVGTDVNRFWEDSRRGTLLTARRTPIVKRNARVFTMGSCFAYEIRKALTRLQFEVFPKWYDVKFNPATQIAGKLPREDNVEHYDTFVLLQEVRDALENTTLSERDFLQLKGTPAGARLGSETIWQDPHRKMVYGTSFEAVYDVNRQYTAQVRRGLEEAEVLVFTLGLIECWRNPVNGRFFCRPPGTGYNGGIGRELAEFHLSTFEENIANVRALLDLILPRFPNKKVVFSVSPVALDATHTSEDIVTANTYSKAVLRAVAGQIMTEYKSTGRVFYMPSFEISQRIDVFGEDGRHVTEQAAQFITGVFEQMFLDNGA